MEEKQSEKKRTFQKSRPYPPYNIQDTLEFASIIEKLGSRNVSEAVLLKELDLKEARTRSFWGKIVSGKQFGLLTVEDGSYTLTDRAKLILRPKDETSKNEALRESFMTPDLYKELCEKFEEKQIPPVESLANILFHDHSINVNASLSTAKAFVESARYVGLLGADNSLKTTSKRILPPAEQEHEDERRKEASGSLRKFLFEERGQGMDDIPIRLPGGRKAHLMIPTPFYETDKEHIIAQIKVIVTDLSEEQDRS